MHDTKRQYVERKHMAFTYGERIIERGLSGADVEELQIRLAGFRGTTPDGKFGPGSELQVVEFQRLFMEMESPTGIANGDTLRAIDQFASAYPVNFNKLKCPCGVCEGFGRGRFKGQYRTGSPRIERYCRYEYPGIHRMVLWALRAAFFLFPQYDFMISSGYRCSEDNKNKNRTSTNHHGKAVDFDVPNKSSETRQDDMNRCEEIRGKLVEVATAQIGWGAGNRKALEPSRIAPTWIHYDVRCYDKKYLNGRFFCTSLKDLNNRCRIKV